MIKAVVLAANYSKRLNPLNETRSKPMIRIAGKYILESILEGISNAGIQEVLLVVHHQQEMIRDHFGFGEQYGLDIDYVEQEELKGIGNALSQCKNMLQQNSFLLIYGDVLMNGNPLPSLLKTYKGMAGNTALLTLPRSSLEFGNVYFDHEMKIRRLIEKPQQGQQANYVFAGGFVLQPKIFDLLEKYDENIEQCFQHLIRENSLQADLWEGGWIDIIYPWHILEANQMMMNTWHTAHIHSSVQFNGEIQIQGAVVIEENVVVEHGSILKGPCYIGKNTYIGNNALIRDCSAIGPNSLIGYGSELKNCVIFGNTKIGRLSFIGDSIIGENTCLGSGLTTVNFAKGNQNMVYKTTTGEINTGSKKLGSFVGDDVWIGARHTLPPLSNVPSGTFMDDHVSFSSY